jgi:hypothetical protein
MKNAIGGACSAHGGGVYRVLVGKPEEKPGVDGRLLLI